MQREWDEPIVIDVRQLALCLRPDELIGIELRRVAWKAVDLDPATALEKCSDVPTPMNLAAIPQQEDLTSEVTEQLAKKHDDLGAGDVAHMEIEIQPEAVATRRHGERRDNGHAIMAVAVPKVRRVPDGRPSLANVGDEQEAALIEEREMGASARGVFLTGAIHPASTERYPPRRAGARGARASANSIRGRAGVAPTRRQDCSEHRTVCG